MPVPFLNAGLKNTTNIGCIERGLGVMGCVDTCYTVLSEDIQKGNWHSWGGGSIERGQGHS